MYGTEPRSRFPSDRVSQIILSTSASLGSSDGMALSLPVSLVILLVDVVGPSPYLLMQT